MSRINRAISICRMHSLSAVTAHTFAFVPITHRPAVSQPLHRCIHRGVAWWRQRAHMQHGYEGECTLTAILLMIAQWNCLEWLPGRRMHSRDARASPPSPPSLPLRRRMLNSKSHCLSFAVFMEFRICYYSNISIPFMVFDKREKCWARRASSGSNGRIWTDESAVSAEVLRMLTAVAFRTKLASNRNTYTLHSAHESNTTIISKYSLCCPWFVPLLTFYFSCQCFRWANGDVSIRIESICFKCHMGPSLWAYHVRMIVPWATCRHVTCTCLCVCVNGSIGHSNHFYERNRFQLFFKPFELLLLYSSAKQSSYTEQEQEQEEVGDEKQKYINAETHRIRVCVLLCCLFSNLNHCLLVFNQIQFQCDDKHSFIELFWDIENWKI